MTEPTGIGVLETMQQDIKDVIERLDDMEQKQQQQKQPQQQQAATTFNINNVDVDALINKAAQAAAREAAREAIKEYRDR